MTLPILLLHDQFDGSWQNYAYFWIYFFKEMEYNLLEEQLQKTLADLEKREKTLAHAEMAVSEFSCMQIIS